MFGLGAGELFLIGAAALILVGPKKLPELAKGLGKGIREFQKAKSDLVTEVHKPQFEYSEEKPPLPGEEDTKKEESKQDSGTSEKREAITPEVVVNDIKEESKEVENNLG